MMKDLLSTYIFLIPLLVGLLSEAVKIMTEGIENGKWHEGLFRPGGMPSSHSALVTSLLIVWYDAMSSRRAIGKQAEVLNRLQHWEHFSERLGHSFKEVVGGIIFGAAVTACGILIST